MPVNSISSVGSYTSTSSSSNVVMLRTEKAFANKVLKAKKPVLVEFMSEACPHCRAAQPMVFALGAQLKGKIPVYQVSLLTTDGKKLAVQYRIQGTPTFITFKGGTEKARILGANLPSIQAALKAVSKPPSP